MAASLAPELLGKGWRSRMGLALNLAIDRGTLDDYQRKAAEKNNQGGGGKVKFIIDAGHGGADATAIPEQLALQD